MASAPDRSIVGPAGLELSRILEEQRRLDERRRVKRAANRKSASTSRARKKAYVDDMTAKNERMKQHAMILSMLPDLVLAVCRSGEMTYVSPACQWLLLHAPEEMTGANIFELVTHDCHPLLRKMISDNLSRPVQQQQHPAARNPIDFDGSGDETADRSDGERATNREDSSPSFRQQPGNHRDRLHKRYRQSQQASLVAGKDGSRGGVGAGRVPGTPPSQAPKMLRLIRCDKTTVWCESRLSVRTSKGDGAGGGGIVAPLEIILTLRTVSEGSKTSMAHGLAGARVPALDCATTSPARPAADTDEYVGADDEGYQCEVEEDSNNSGSGNDSGTSRVKSGSSGGAGGGEGAGCVTNKRSSSSGGGVKDGEERAEEKGSPASSPDPVEGREERSLTKKRQRVSISNRMEDMMSAAAREGGRAGDVDGACDGDANKSGEEDSSTGADTGGSTTQEGSASGSNEVDSNGEGSNNGSSKWGDGCGGDTGFADRRGPPCGGDYRGSETGSSDGSSAAGGDLADEMQNAVQSLILMGGSYGSEGPQ